MDLLAVCRFASAALGIIMLSGLSYTLATDGSPFRWELFTPWMGATLLDFYVNVTIIAAWVVYKENSMLNRLIWVALLVCTGSIATAAYVLLQLLKVSSSDPNWVAKVLLRPRDALARAEDGERLIGGASTT